VQPWRDAWVWESVAEEIGDHRRRGYGAIVTEDVLRFAAARAIGEAGSGSASLRLERPHPSLPGSRVDLAIGEPPEAVIEFNYPCEPIEANAEWTKAFAEILKDLYRLGVHPGDADRILVLALRQHPRDYMASSAGRYGVDLDSDRVSLTAEAAAAFPRSAAAVIGDELRDHQVVASRLWALDVDDDLRISVFLVDPIAGPSNSLVALAVLPRSDASPLPRSGPVSRAAEGGLVAFPKAQHANDSSEHLTIWYQLAKCVTQLDEPFNRSEIIGWFRRHYPKTKESSLAAHIQSATANGGHATGQFASRRPLLIRVEHGVYRRYRSEAD
jgi:hypothetical protein